MWFLKSSPAMSIDPPDLIDLATLAQALEISRLDIQVEVLDQCPSTNALLLERARAGAPHASAIVCERQTAGKGRRGSAWVSASGASLTFSLLWRFDSSVLALSGLSLAVAVASARALEAQGGTQLTLKWPNDLLFDGRKLGGILIETLTGANSTVAVLSLIHI